MVLTEEERKERKRIAAMKYNQSEKGKKSRQIAYEKQKQNGNRKEYQREYYINNKERKKKYNQSERGKEKAKLRRKTENGKKLEKKNKWKGRGLNMVNFEEIYKRYQDAIFCDICECVLNVEGDYNSKKCLDHDHETGEFRNVVCNYCNVVICK